MLGRGPEAMFVPPHASQRVPCPAVLMYMAGSVGQAQHTSGQTLTWEPVTLISPSGPAPPPGALVLRLMRLTETCS